MTERWLFLPAEVEATLAAVEEAVEVVGNCILFTASFFDLFLAAWDSDSFDSSVTMSQKGTKKLAKTTSNE